MTNETIQKIVIIRSTPIEALISGDQMIQAVANLDTTATVKKGQILYGDTSQKGYLITGEPRYNRLFKRWRVELKEAKVSIS
jgi:CHASE3 domain sensor protein